MAAFRFHGFQHISSKPASLVRPIQRRWAQVHDVRFLVTHQRSASIAEKYKDKLQDKAKQEGLTNVNELKATYKNKINAQKKQALATDPLAAKGPRFSPPPLPSSSEQKSSTPVDDQSSNIRKPLYPAGIKPLSSYVDVSKTLKLPQKEIEYIWRLRHASNPSSLCAIVPHATYKRIEAIARRHPQFILPLPREDKGAEIHFLQWAFPTPTVSTVLFTHLAEYQLRGEYAQPHTTVTHHLDIADDKGLVLLQGGVMDGKGITVAEGKWLLMCLQKFYGGEETQTTERTKLLEQFSQGDSDFKVEALLEEAEKIV